VEQVRRITIAGRTSLEELQAIVHKHESTYGPLKAIARAGRITRLTFAKGSAPEQLAVLMTYVGKTAARKRRHELVLTGEGVIAGRAARLAVYRSRDIVAEEESSRHGEIEAEQRPPVEEFEVDSMFSDSDERQDYGRPGGRTETRSEGREDREASADPHGWGGGPPRGTAKSGELS
jgi:hypothetical protein